MKALAIAAVLIAVAAGCDARREAAPVAVVSVSDSGTATSVPQRAGDPAVWWVAPGDVSSESITFTAQVSRLACNSGVTGAVRAPTVQADDSQIVVTFTVKPLDTAGENFSPRHWAAMRNAIVTCQSNAPVSVRVDVGEPIGSRLLEDGACRADSEASRTSFCAVDGSVRWKA